jgi:hypothetical protein
MLAGLAIAVATYRLVLEAPPKTAHDKPASDAATTAPARVQKSSVPVKSEKPAAATPGSRSVPPPPAR